MGCSRLLAAGLTATFLSGCMTAFVRPANHSEAIFADDAAVQAREYALGKLPSGARHDWKNSQTGAHGSLVVVATYRKPEQRICRELKEEAVLKNGRGVELHSVYCLAPGHGWTKAAAG